MSQKTIKKSTPAVRKKTAAPVSLKQQFTSARGNRLFILAFFLWALILYGNTLLNKFAIDDEYVTNNDLVKQGVKAIPTIFKTYYVESKGNIGNQVADYRPVVKTTFALEYQILGHKPGISHIINVLFYFWLSTVLFFLLKRFFRDYNILFPFLITILFMAHPVHTEVVASLKNRDEIIAMLCALGAMHYFIKYADTKKAYNILIGCVLYFIGYLSKSSILPFLALYPLALYFFTDLKPSKYIPVFLAVVLAAALAHYLPRLYLPGASRVNSFVENPLYFDHNLWHRIGTGLTGLFFYLRILVYPHPLLYYYGYNMFPVTNLASFWAILSLLIYGGLLLYALRKFREKTVLSFAILWFMVAISMYSNVIVPVVGIVGERFVFVASLGFCIALVYLIFKLFRTDPKSLTIEFDSRAKILVVIFLILVPYTALTITRNREWRNMFDLFRKDVPYLENSAKANTQYAGYLMNMVYKDENYLQYGAVNEFIKDRILTHFKRSLEIYPDSYQTLNDLGSVYLFLDKKPDSAIMYLKKAIALKPDLTPSYVNLGMAYREKGQYDSAIVCYNTILSKRPNEIRAVFALANIYNDMGDFNRAVQMNEDVSKQYPQLDIPYVNIGNYYMMKGDTAMAVKNWEKAVERRPTYEGCMQLNYLYKVHGDMEKADYYARLAGEVMNQNKNK